MYFVSKGGTQVKVPERADAIALVNSLNELDCPDQITKQELIGTVPKSDIFELSYMGMEVNVVGKDDALTVIDWLLTLKCTDISIEGKQ